jgi:hypothetical protein
MGFKSRKILLARTTLVRDDHHTTVRKCTDRGEMLPEPLVIQNKMGGGVNRGVQVKPEQYRLVAAPQFPDCTDRHPYYLPL